MLTSRSDHFLAIETAIGGGSIALFEGTELKDQFIGPSGRSRAEDLLSNIAGVLESNKVSAAALSEIVVGAGPGSFTGIRIGIATAYGLSASLGIPVRLNSTIGAIASTSSVADPIAALPIGRDTVCVQSFSRANGKILATTEPEAISHQAFIVKITEGPSRIFVVCRSLFEEIPSDLRGNIHNCGEGLANLIGRAANAGLIPDLSAPLFIGKQK